MPWEVAKKKFGALLVLNEEAFEGVSVLCTREPIEHWSMSLRHFPSGETSVEKLASDEWNSFNRSLQEVSPHVFLGDDGNLQAGWNCRSLLQAMYVMLYLDLTGDNTIKECESGGCHNHFRVGAQTEVKYCSRRCANRASTRRWRGQEP